MKAYRKLMVATLAAAVLAAVTPNARAQMVSQKIQVKFSGPVELPGTVLPSGSYVFESMDSGHMTRVFNADQSEVLGTFLTVPEDRRETAEKAIVELGESVSGAPRKVQSWFSPGKSVGDEFIYDHPAGK